MIDYIRRNLKNIVIYLLFGLLVYGIAIYLTFPYEKIVSGFVSDLERQHNIIIKTDSISPILPLGVKAKGVQFASHEITGGQFLKLNTVKATVPIIGLLLYPFTSSISSDFFVGFPKGRLKGLARVDKDILDLSLNAKDLDLSSIKPVLSQSGLILEGMANADIITSMNKRTFARSALQATLAGRGEFNLEIRNFKIKMGQASYGGGSLGQMTSFLGMIPVIPLIKTKAVLNNGLIQFKDLYVEKEGLKGNIRGVIKLEQRTMDTMIDLTLNLTLEPDESLLRPMLSLYGQAIGCPLNPNNTVSCKINGTIAELTNP